MRSLDSAQLPLRESSVCPVPSTGLESRFYLLFLPGNKEKGSLCILRSSAFIFHT